MWSHVALILCLLVAHGCAKKPKKPKPSGHTPAVQVNQTVSAFSRGRSGFGWRNNRKNVSEFNLFGFAFHEVEAAPWNAWDAQRKTWRSHKVVLVAIYKEFVAHGLPNWITQSTPEMGWTIFFYQRLQPDGPRFAPNFAQEGGVMAKFVHDFYPNLPNITILMQAEPHTRLFLRYIDCLLPNISYTTMDPWKVRTRTVLPKADPRALIWFENCVRQVLKVVQHPLKARQKFLPLQFTMGDQFAVSRETLLRFPHETWTAVYNHLGKGPVCSKHMPVAGELMQKVSPKAVSMEKPITKGRLANGRLYAHVLEMFQHVIFGGRPVFDALVPVKDTFRNDDVCPGSPHWSARPEAELSNSTRCLRASFGNVWQRCTEDGWRGMPVTWLSAFASYTGRLYMSNPEHA